MTSASVGTPSPITVNLRAADGATYQLLIPAPHVRPTVRVADVRAFPIGTTLAWDGTKWQPVTN